MLHDVFMVSQSHAFSQDWGITPSAITSSLWLARHWDHCGDALESAFVLHDVFMYNSILW